MRARFLVLLSERRWIDFLAVTLGGFVPWLVDLSGVLA